MSWFARSFSEGFSSTKIVGRFYGNSPKSSSSSKTVDVKKLSLDDDEITCPNEDDFDYYDEEDDDDLDAHGITNSQEIDFYQHNPALVIVDPGPYSGGCGSSSSSSPIIVYSKGFSNSRNSSRSTQSGPLRDREVEVLKKGVQEAIKTRNPDEIHEEHMERIDAEQERAFRLAASFSVGASADKLNGMKRFKLLMLGDSGVGKSSLMIRWTEDTFSTDMVGTVGVNFKTKRESINGEMVHAQVWDTAGQEQFHKITTSYYKGAHGIMLVYDVSDSKSWENIQYWVKNIRAHASESVQIVLIGNKFDLREDSTVQCVRPSLGKRFSKKFGVPYFETSAKNSTNVSLAFHHLLANVLAVSKSLH